MHKVFLTALFSLVLIFPQSVTFAAACPIGKTPQCPPDGAPEFTEINGAQCRKPASSELRDPTTCTDANPAAVGAAPAAKAPVAPPEEVFCSKPENKDKCTGGKGLSCGIGTGELGKFTPETSGIMTAIGCIPTNPQKLVEGLLWYGSLAAGGVAFLIMLLAALQMITAEGNPESIKQAQERFYSAIIGLLVIIFAVLLLQVIGVDILNLPGFER